MAFNPPFPASYYIVDTVDEQGNVVWYARAPDPNDFPVGVQPTALKLSFTGTSRMYAGMAFAYFYTSNVPSYQTFTPDIDHYDTGLLRTVYISSDDGTTAVYTIDLTGLSAGILTDPNPILESPSSAGYGGAIILDKINTHIADIVLSNIEWIGIDTVTQPDFWTNNIGQAESCP